MARDVTIEGGRYRERMPLGVFALSAVTLGVYFLYWYYRVNDDARRYLRDYDILPIRSVLALLVAGLVVAPALWMVFGHGGERFAVGIPLAALCVLPAIVSFRRTALRTGRVLAKAGVEGYAGLLTWILLTVLSFIGAASVQASLNRAWRSPAADTRRREPLPPTATAPPSAHAAPRPAGRNLVTPDDLGSRVTFQFELPNGYLSEAVGVFERWDPAAETYFVRKKDGTEVRVPARGVRHGKVIPAPAPAPTPGP